MKQRHNRIRLNRYTTGTLAVVIVSVSTVVALQHNRTDAAPFVKPTAAAVKSQFSFTGTPDWWQGATNGTSMALFHTTDGCFTSAQYKTGTVDVAAELQKDSAGPAGTGSTTPGAILTATLQTSVGLQQYQLHQYALASTGGEKLMSGLELGYLKLPNGYVKLEGHCDTPDQLPATIPALQAIKFSAPQ